MLHHPHFDLNLYSTPQLERALDTTITNRVTLHEWPLSVVEAVITTDGTEWIYKAQRNPSVEVAFYDAARSPLLLTPIALPSTPTDQTHLLLPKIVGNRLDRQTMDGESTVAACKAVVAAIGTITGCFPTYLDLSTVDAWHELVGTVQQRLMTLHRAGVFVRTDRARIDLFREVALNKEIEATFDGAVGLVHGDLTNENVFIAERGYRVIDWQRPIIGPRALDLVTLLQSLGHSARTHVDPGILQLHDLLQVEWFSACAAQWFPAGSETYDGVVAACVEKASLLFK